MQGLLRMIQRHADLAAALAVVCVVVMLVIPLPAALLDFLIVINICFALTLVVVTMYVPEALQLSAFPSLLLLTTMFRLALNVSVTRLILLHGDAGDVIHAFGSFVVGGNLVVGIVIFLILVIIQFVVITNGAGRVAEVAARFTLDAMPGKQIAIDADLQAGQITEEEARTRREDIMREADFYGAMDGASKFVKGDAIAGVIIVAINLIGGMAIGVLQQKVSLAEAIQTYSLLTIGDGLAAQIPALLISTATGILVTRAASQADLGTDVVGQIQRQPKALRVAGAVSLVIAFIPGMPTIPFLVIGAALFLLGRSLSGQVDAQQAEAEQTRSRQEEEGRRRDPTLEAVTVDPLELAIGFGLIPMVNTSSGGTLLSRVSSVRQQIAAELGVVIAPVRIHDDPRLDSHEYEIKVRGATVTQAHILADHLLAINPSEVLQEIAGIPTTEPAFGLPAVWIPESERAQAEAFGYTVVDTESVIITHLTEVIRRNVDDLLSRQETKKMLDALRHDNAAVVDEVVPDRLSVGEVQRVLQALLAEGVPVRDLSVIMEVIGDKAVQNRDPAALAEYARQALGRTIVQPYLDSSRTLRALVLDSEVELELDGAITPTPDGERMALEPRRADSLIGGLAQEAAQATALGFQPVVLCSSRIRRHLRRLLAQRAPQLPVLAYPEIPESINVEALASVGAPGAPAG